MESQREGADIVIHRAPDGEPWAKFLSDKLNSDAYKIPTQLLPLPISPKSLTRPQGRPGSKTYRDGAPARPAERQRKRTGSQSPRESVTSEASSRPPSGHSQDGEASTAVHVVLLSPLIMVPEEFCKSDFSLLDPRITLIILLGVGTSDLYEVAGDDSAMSDFTVLEAEQSPESVKEILVKIIKVYEQEDDVDDDDSDYQVPLSPRQVNRLHAVLPAHVERGGEVFLVLDRRAEGDLHVHLHGNTQNSEVDIASQFEQKALYQVQLPDHILGELEVSVSSKDQTLGQGRLRVGPQTKQLCPEASASPSLSQLLMTLAMGVGLEDRGVVDARLARQLRERVSPQALGLLQSLSSAGTSSETSCRYEWPTLLHFAASEGFEQFAQELLHYPGMLEAALAENCHGDTPVQIASHRGYPRIAKLVEEFVVRQHSADSGILMKEDAPPPSPHLSGHTYYNRHGYVDMTAGQHGDTDSVFLSPNTEGGRIVYRRISDDSNKEQRESSIPFMNDPPTEPEGRSQGSKLPGPASFDVASTSPPTDLPPKRKGRHELFNSSPPPSSCGDNSTSQRNSQERMPSIQETSNPKESCETEVIPQDPEPTAFHGLNSDLLAKLSLVHESACTTCDEDDTMTPEEEAMMRARTTRSQSMQEKFSNFFRKLAHPRRNTRHSEAQDTLDRSSKKRTSSLLDDPSSGFGLGTKAVFYVKTGGKRLAEESSLERDSGSYSDDEESKGRSKKHLHGKKKEDKKKGRGKMLTRKKSVRVSRAMQECGTDAPSVPYHRR